MEKNICQNCGRILAENEVYCYFCEMEAENFEEKAKKSRQKEKISFKNKNPGKK